MPGPYNSVGSGLKGAIDSNKALQRASTPARYSGSATMYRSLLRMPLSTKRAATIGSIGLTAAGPPAVLAGGRGRGGPPAPGRRGGAPGATAGGPSFFRVAGR